MQKSTTSLRFAVFAILLAAVLVLLATGAYALSAKEKLGKDIFFDTNLSSPAGMSCGTCHDPNTGFDDPDDDSPTSAGVMPLRVGLRNAPTVTYKKGNPPASENDPVTTFFGGQFWDGRAASTIEQAKAPFVNPIEMHSPNHRYVVLELKKAKYAEDFKAVFGQSIFSDVETAYAAMAEAIAAFEDSDEMNKFSSKFDKFLDGQATLTAQEEQGRALFFNQGRVPTNCFICHHSPNGLAPDAKQAPFTDFRFFNVGVPKNANNPFYTTIPDLNPDGFNFVDLGLGGRLINEGRDQAVTDLFLGTFKVPSLRNIALTAPYMHNGVFTSLKDVVHFYNVRDVPDSGIADPEVDKNIFDQIILPNGVVLDFLGNLGLTSDEEDALVAFLKTLTDQ